MANELDVPAIKVEQFIEWLTEACPADAWLLSPGCEASRGNEIEFENAVLMALRWHKQKTKGKALFCTITGCHSLAHAQTLCRHHYDQKRYQQKGQVSGAELI